VSTQPQRSKDFTDAPSPPDPGGGPPEKSFWRVWTGLPGLLKSLAALVTAVGTLIGVLVATHGSNGSSPPPPPASLAADTSLNKWIDGANGICRSMSVQMSTIPQPQTLQDYEVFVPEAIGIIQAHLRQFRQLKTPPAEAGQIERMLGTANDGITSLQNMLQALEVGDNLIAEESRTQFNNDNAAWNAIAADIGAQDCAQ